MSGAAQPAKSRLPWKMVEVGLWLVAAACLAVTVRSRVEARATNQASEAIETHVENESRFGRSAEAPAKNGAVIGRLSIREVGLSVPVLESYDPGTLSRGVGHVPGTAVPGGLGNLVLAGHRDTYFRPLRNVRTGMQIVVATRAGRWNYFVDSMEVVTPDRVDITDIGERPEMTLITCYPFDFIGAAPKRFIVHAHLLSADPG